MNWKQNEGESSSSTGRPPIHSSPSVSSLRKELRQEFQRRMKDKRASAFDNSRLIEETINESCIAVQDRLKFSTIPDEDIDTSINTFQVIKEEMMELELRMLLETMEDDESKEIEAILNCHQIMCKICNNYIEPQHGNVTKDFCDNCIKYM